jgi:hypothetical protein
MENVGNQRPRRIGNQPKLVTHVEKAQPVQQQQRGVAETTASLPAPIVEPAHFDAIDSRVPAALTPIQAALGDNWKFLYDRADPARAASEPGVEFTRRRTDINNQGVQAGMEALKKDGFDLRQERVLVLGGGYEVDLAPLLAQFKEVHVVDLCLDPLKLAARKYTTHPDRERLRLVAADLSGIPAAYQAKEIARTRAERAQTNAAPDVDAMAAFFASMPEKLEPLPFETGAYAMVVSPVLHESLPFGPAVCAFEEARQAEHEKTGNPVARQSIDSHLGEAFYYRPDVHDATLRIFRHNREELQRLTKPRGRVAYTSWKREDEKKQTYAPNDLHQLVRVGDSRLTTDEWESLFSGWAGSEQLHQEQIYPGKLPTLNLFLLSRGDPEPEHKRKPQPGVTSQLAALRQWSPSR